MTEQTITITFGDCAENHKGMEIYGNLVDEGEGFSVEELRKLSEKIDGSEFHKLNNSKQPEAAILIVRNGVDLLLKDKGWNANDLLNEQLSLDWDKQCFMYGRVVNKHARWNLCYDDFEKEPDYENKSGRVVDYKNIPITRELREQLSKFFGPKAENLKGEGNYYYDNKKCGIGFHGDSERRKVIAARLGSSLSICYQWFLDGERVGKRLDFQLNKGDIYIMSEKAVGTDWKKKKIYTLRHAAGCVKFIGKDEKKRNVKIVFEESDSDEESDSEQ